MTWAWSWNWLLPWRQIKDTSREARAQLRRLEERDREVAQLGQELRELQLRNHFSQMVGDAINRSSGRGSP